MEYQTVTAYRVAISRCGEVKIETSRLPYEFFNLPQAAYYHRNIKDAKKAAQNARELINLHGVDYCLWNGLLDID